MMWQHAAAWLVGVVKSVSGCVERWLMVVVVALGSVPRIKLVEKRKKKSPRRYVVVLFLDGI
jgi:hypothetical protein